MDLNRPCGARVSKKAPNAYTKPELIELAIQSGYKKTEASRMTKEKLCEILKKKTRKSVRKSPRKSVKKSPRKSVKKSTKKTSKKSVKKSSKGIKCDILRSDILTNCREKLHKWILDNGLDLKKVQTLTPPTIP